jgi:ERO1-like protein beta
LIYQKSDSKAYYNLKQKRLNTDKMCLEGRTFYRLISGLHTSITIHLCTQHFFPTIGGGYSRSDGQWGANLEEFKRRLDSETTDNESPKWLKNVYFIFFIELHAIYKAREFSKDQI